MIRFMPIESVLPVLAIALGACAFMLSIHPRVASGRGAGPSALARAAGRVAAIFAMAVGIIDLAGELPRPPAVSLALTGLVAGFGFAVLVNTLLVGRRTRH
ncbi:hypothetical protein DVS28_b0612 (plasmid) [Euzebya pacifica]|uniref:Uncharacterized protein n=2 Tax=Euzebya pacifica TaxID=1608957 RepID=A0A346Y7A5_9ACTN|nr:hypothetical protein DVS28_b0612 [Euzebya pacifica]